jgi:proline utilization trans-activator
MILTTRPILLHLAKLKLEGKDSNKVVSGVPALHKLATVCIEAAGVSLDILRLLKQHSILGM